MEAQRPVGRHVGTTDQLEGGGGGGGGGGRGEGGRQKEDGNMIFNWGGGALYFKKMPNNLNPRKL